MDDLPFLFSLADIVIIFLRAILKLKLFINKSPDRCWVVLISRRIVVVPLSLCVYDNLNVA